MSYVAAAVGIASIGSSFIGSSKAKAAAKHTARMEALSNEIQTAQIFSNAAIQSQDLESQFVGDESASTAIASAQGRRREGGSLQAISKERKNMLDTNKQRLQDNAEMGGDLMAINTSIANQRASSSISAQKAAMWSGVITGTAQAAGGVANIMAD